VRGVVTQPDLRNEGKVMHSLIWLLPVGIVGAGVYLLSGFAGGAVDSSGVFLAAMAFIGLIVFAVSRDVALFLVETGLLFDEFLARVSRLAIPAFAFLTSYALLVIMFGAVYSIVSRYSAGPHFRVHDVMRPISFSEGIYFSVVSLSTVGYGDIVPASGPVRLLASLEVICGMMLLMFGVSELLEYMREHRERRMRDRGHREGE
jgi:voltage-gated potassium channel